MSLVGTIEKTALAIVYALLYRDHKRLIPGQIQELIVFLFFLIHLQSSIHLFLVISAWSSALPEVNYAEMDWLLKACHSTKKKKKSYSSIKGLLTGYRMNLTH